MAQGVVRHVRGKPCPICGGYGEMPQGKGIRCAGFTTGLYVYCQREQLANGLPEEDTPVVTYRHWMGDGQCRCGVNHSGREAPPRRAPGRSGPPPASAPEKSTSGGDSDAWADWIRQHAPTAEFEYLDPWTSAPVAVHGRWERDDPTSTKGYAKTYRWRLPKVDWKAGGYGRGLQGMSSKDPPPWRAEKLAVLPPGSRIWIVEGEPAVLALEEQGEVATCWPGGGGQVEFPDQWVELLRGHHLMLFPDNDAQGRKHMAACKLFVAGKAKSTTYVTPALPHKGDAVDYFKAGGTLDALLKDVLTGPALLVMADDHLRVRLPNEGGPIEFDFENLGFDRRGLSANITVRVPGAEDEYEGEYSLASASSRETFARQLGKLYGKDYQWDSYINTCWSRVKRAFREIDPSVAIGDLPDDDETPFAIDELLPARTTSVYFGRGESTKSYFAEGAILAIAMGSPEFAGFKVNLNGPVLIVDYEDPGAMRMRMKRMLLGLGLDPQILPELPIRWFPPKGAPLVAIAPQVKHAAERWGAVALAVDSAMPACGGEPERAEPASQFFNALDKIGLTNLVISHASHAQIESGELRAPYGNVVWENRPRKTFAFLRSGEPGADVFQVAVLNQKSNVKRSPPYAFEWAFDGRRGPVTVKKIPFRAVDEFVDQLPALERITKLLRTRPPMTVSDIAREMGMRAQTVSRACTKGQKEGTLRIDSGGRGKTTYWTVP